MAGKASLSGERRLARVKDVGGIVLGVMDNRSWIELLYEGDLRGGKQVDLPAGVLFDIFVEEISHMCTIYEHPRTIIYFKGPSALEIVRDGNRIIVRGRSNDEEQSSKRSAAKVRKPSEVTRRSPKRAR